MSRNERLRLARESATQTVSDEKDTLVGETTMADETKEAPKVETPKVELIDKAGKTRGKNPRDITFKVLSAIPTSIKQFAEVTNTQTEPEICEYLFEGFNSLQYAAASDEIGEFINDAWDKDTQNQFRLAVRNYSKMTGFSIEDAVNLIKPGLDKAWAAKQEAAKQENKPAA